MSTDGSKYELTELVESCRKGDPAAWKELIRRISPVVFSVCRSMKLTREESFDIFGQVSYLLLTHLDSLRSPEKVLSYVGTTTRREVYALTRRAGMHEHIEDQQDTDLRLATHVSPDKQYEEVQESELIAKAMVQLPKRDFELLKTLFFDEEVSSYEETSKKLKMPVASIGPTRARSLQRLKRILKRLGYKL
ncbi:MAG TPA: sigma-70 family RNA polymerase sigma factor [candidate division Zixibacteria bacterium]|nr:sigma-70 family RNA polymerase sigma factor [candidate division Zixibacteria bacterium]